jgi:uncharacterized protein YoxC
MMDRSVILLIWIQAIGLILVVIALIIIASFARKLIDKLIAMIDTLKGEVEGLDTELKPIMQDIQKVLADLEPLAREVGQRGEQIGMILENLEKVSDDVQATSGAIRNGVVPIAHSLSGLFAGFIEGRRAFGEYTRRNPR